MSFLKRLIVIVIAALLTPAVCLAQADKGGSGGDPTVKPAADPHGAIRSMSQSADPGSKPDHSVTTVPALAPGQGGSGAEKGRSGPR